MHFWTKSSMWQFRVEGQCGMYRDILSVLNHVGNQGFADWHDLLFVNVCRRVYDIEHMP